MFYTAGLLYLAQKITVKECEYHEEQGLDLSTKQVVIASTMAKY